MTEAPSQPSADGKPDDNSGGGSENTDPNKKTDDKPSTGDTGSTVDLTKLPAEQLAKVLEHPDFFNLPRIKELREGAAEAKRLKEEASTNEEKSLEQQKKYQELAEKRGNENTQLKEQLKNMSIDQALTTKLAGEGVVDLDGALRLADRNKVEVSEDGSVKGVDDVVKALKEDRSYLFTNESGTPKKVGSPSAQGGEGGEAPKKFKRSQLRDPKFYKEHEKEIEEAARNGLIEDDLT